MNQKTSNDRSKVKNPLDPAFKAAANNRAGQLDTNSEKFQGSEQKALTDRSQTSGSTKQSK